ncbi:MAG: phosphate acyltransferase PlsX [Armatimonadota bacterium]
MIIAVDAMGGDFAPDQIVKGAAHAADHFGINVVLIGDEIEIAECLPGKHSGSKRITIRHTTEKIEMGENAAAVRTKKDASVVVAADMVKNGEADAMVSVGNTAAAMTVATLKLGRIEGIDKPAIATVWPSKSGPVVMLDAGAVVDCGPENLEEFAVMGSVYSEKVLNIKNPRVGLLSVGEEKCKGNNVTKRAYEAIEKSGLQFVGNVEGRDLFTGICDVLVTDGFSGNIALKTGEGIVEYVSNVIKEDLKSHPFAWIPLVLLTPMFRRIKKKLDYSEYGGAPLLGLNGVCIIGHGRSNARAVTNAVRAARDAVNGDIVGTIKSAIFEMEKKISTSV